MPGNNSNLSTIKKEDDASATAQHAAATAHGEQEALVATMATAHKTLDEARACEYTAALS
jgi:hypothetical protein